MLQFIPSNLEDKIQLNTSLKPKLYTKRKMKQYLYTIKFTYSEEALCKLEMKCLFNKIPQNNYFFSYHYINPHRSPFIKQCISIIFLGSTIEEIVSQILSNNLCYEKFKVYCFNIDKEAINFNDRRRIESLIGFNIKGQADIHNPQILLGITKVNGKWIFGELEVNKSSWMEHNKKPYYYSNALGVKTARAIVNIATANHLEYSVIDPCCGIGTVLIEALSLKINIKGYEINPSIAENAKRNLEFFGYEDIVTTGDMHNIKDNFDAAIIDLPYGLFSITTLKEQLDILKTARKIAKKLVLVTMENMDNFLIVCGFTIVDRCVISKGKFNRYITVCR